MKIGLVLDDSLDKTDGVQQYVLTLGQWLSAQGHDVHYLVGSTKRTDLPNLHSLSRNLAVRFNRNNMSMPLPARRSPIRDLLQKEKFDILHVQMPYSPFLAGRIIKMASPNTKIIGTFHVAPHSRLVTLANWLLHIWLHRSLKRFSKVISVSAVAADFAKRTFGLAGSVVPNAVNLKKFYNAGPLAEYENIPTIVFLGRLVERKGCQYLLQAVNIMHRQKLMPTPFRVVICGRGPLENFCRQYVLENQLTEIVEFVGYVSEAEKPHYLASADVAIFPSTGGESFGIVLVEAMAAARGVVLAGDNPGYASVMAPRPESLFNPKDAQALAEKLASILQNLSERQAAHSWQKSYAQQFDISQVGQQIVKVYKEALQGRRQ